MSEQALGEEALDDELEIIELTDEEGNKHPFYFYDSIELDGKTYVLLLPVEEAENEEEPEMLVLRQGADEADLEVIDDEDEFNRVVAALQAEAEEEAEDEA